MTALDGQSDQFVAALLALHQPISPSPDYPVVMCTCGRSATCCEVLCAGRDVGLLPPLVVTSNEVIA